MSEEEPLLEPRHRLQTAARAVQTAVAIAQSAPLRRLSKPNSAAPGIDLRHPPEHITQTTSASGHVTVVDYSDTQIETKLIAYDNLASFFLRTEKPAWSGVRWINLSGLDFNAMKVLGLEFKLHPLAVEDVFHLPQRIKADFFEDHLYVSMLLPLLRLPTEECQALKDSDPLDSTLPCLFKDHHMKLKKTNLTAIELSQLIRPNAYLEECSFFLLNNNTILSIFQSCGRQITDRIFEVLYGTPPTSNTPLHDISAGTNHQAHSPNTSPTSCCFVPPQTPIHEFLESLKQRADPTRLTLLRRSQDPSFLLHSLMDSCVDRYFDLTEFYERQIGVVQDLVLDKPKASYTKTLHLMLKEVNMLRRRLQPTEKLLQTLKDDQFEGKVHAAETVGGGHQQHQKRRISELTKTYFVDVLDHCLTVLDELASIDQTATGLIDLTFNTISHQTNENMKFLAVISFIFLPITFLAGVFGMNFIYFPELGYGLGVYYFWLLCALLVLISLIGSWRLGLFS
ncbi:hypothetical protein BDR26DRAFT_1011723, partial [Obelidium mucronatum]